jgi:hypothetical protein
MNPVFIYFTKFDLFSGGLLGFASLFAFLYVFTFFGVRGQFDKPHEKTLELLLPSVLIGFFLNLFGINSLIVGIVVVAIYLIFSKKYLKLSTHEWTTNSIKVTFLLIIFGSIDEFSRWILFGIYLVYSIIMSEKRISDNKKDDKKKN